MRNYFTEEQEKKIIELYTKEQRGQLYCAKAVGSTNVQKVKQVLKKYNIPIRNFSQAATASNQNRALKKDEDFFKTETHDMAWVLGFLASDGCICKDTNKIMISLQKRDEEVLRKLKEIIGIENEIKYYTTKDGFEVAKLQWTCAEHKKDLARYGIIPQKTFELIPPYNLDKKYWIDYIRGYFDGDGSINHIHRYTEKGRGNGSLRWQLCAATEDILNFVVDYFEELGIPRVNIQIRNKEGQKPLYYIQYSSVATRKIHDILYTPNSIFLPRKKEHFDYILTQVKPLMK